ncbi:DsbA family protein [Actinoplanes rectilineatus]|uniref:DsbA family protein n=1 Tax=Actinoplanes rectilineatus TaxID=113571 RepID=UPI0005F2B768|nr:thioredoxin domain-containing protein [Actinoplanes rectilineatus]
MSKKAKNRREAAQKAVTRARGGQRGNRVVMGIGGVVIVALVAAIAVSVTSAMRGSSGGGGGALVTPAAATGDGGIRVGPEGAATTVAVYLDYMCPYCGKFERANSGDLTALVEDGTTALELHPLSFLDAQSQGNRYSTRAANAVVTVADKDSERVLAFNAALFANQPDEGSAGLDDAAIAELAAGAGVSQAVIDTFGDRIYVPWIEKTTEAAFDGGITGTPTVLINGVKTGVDLYTAGPLREAVIAAAGAAR